MASALLDHLHGLLDDATADLPGVSKKRLFGSLGWFAEGHLIAIAWRSGRLIFKLPEDQAADELSSLPGAEPWVLKAGKPMRNWVLAPESFHDDLDAVRTWTRRAHAMAGQKAPTAAERRKAANPARKTSKPARKAAKPAPKAAAKPARKAPTPARKAPTPARKAPKPARTRGGRRG